MATQKRIVFNNKVWVNKLPSGEFQAEVRINNQTYTCTNPSEYNATKEIFDKHLVPHVLRQLSQKGSQQPLLPMPPSTKAAKPDKNKKKYNPRDIQNIQHPGCRDHCQTWEVLKDKGRCHRECDQFPGKNL